MNSKKLDFEDVLDPFTLPKSTFRLELVTGRLYVRPGLPKAAASAANDTIERLALDAAGPREMRTRHFSEYVAGDFTAEHLRRISPFVWAEARRQGLL